MKTRELIKSIVQNLDTTGIKSKYLIRIVRDIVKKYKDKNINDERLIKNEVLNVLEQNKNMIEEIRKKIKMNRINLQDKNQVIIQLDNIKDILDKFDSIYVTDSVINVVYNNEYGQIDIVFKIRLESFKI